MSKQYDVFLSHNSADKAAVELIARRLQEEAGLNPFLDKWHLVPGVSWQSALEEALEASESVAVFIGPSGVSPWHNEELRAALNQAVQTRDEYRIIPVLLPEANPEDVSTFLAQRTWVDFRSGIDGQEAFDRLVAGIKGEAITNGSYELPDEPAPYRGLLRFEAEQAEFFFGREADTKNLVDKVSQSSFVAVIGASGSGKSSLVRAGLIPALSEEAIPGSEKWQHIIFTPGSYPIRALAEQLATLSKAEDRLGLADQLETRLLAQPNGLRTAVSTFLADRTDEAGSVLIVIDQFEELFTLCLETQQQRCNEQAEAFIQNIADATKGSNQQIHMVITLRADFLNHCLSFPALKILLQDNQLLLGPLDQSVLRDVIVRPAQTVGAFFEKGLVTTILRDIEDNPGSLPLLQHALYELWRARQGPWLTLEAYEKTGGVSGALQRRAQNTYDSLSTEQQKIARNIFLRLTALGEGVSDTRRRVDLDELYLTGIDKTQIETVLQKLSGPNARLIVTTETEAEVAHEALIQGWGTLRNWLDLDREGLRIHRTLTQDAEEWEDLKRDEGALYRGARLAQALEWAAAHESELNPLESEFLSASQEHEVNELEEAQRQASRLRQRAIFLTGALVIAMIAAFFALQFWNRAANTAEENLALAEEALAQQAIAEAASTQAIAQQATAEAAKEDAIEQQQRAEAASTQAVAQQATAEAERREAERQARQVFANNLAAQALAFYETYPQQSLLLAVEGGRVIAENQESEPASLRLFLFRALREVSGIGLSGHQDEISSVAFSPDNRWLATSSRDGTLQLWDMTNPVDQEHPIRMPTGMITLEGEIFTVTFSPDSRWLVASGKEKNIWGWDLSDTISLADPMMLEGHESIVDFIQFNPQDSNQLVSGSRDKTAKIWDLSAANPSENPLTLEHDGDITALQFSTDGLWLATGSADNAVRLWNMNAEDLADEVITLTGHEEAITDLAFSPDNAFLASASVDRSARVWNIATPVEEITSTRLAGHRGEIRSVTFSKDGQALFTGSLDGTIRVWDLTAPDPGFRPTVLQGHRESIIAMALATEGDWLVSGSTKGTVGLWNLAAFNPALEPIILRGHEGSIRTIDISPDGRWLATGSIDQSVRIWDLESPSASTFPIALKGHNKSIQAIDISPNGRWAASGSNDDQVRLWNLDAANPHTNSIILEGHTGNILSAEFSPDGRWLATGATDDIIRLWDLNALPDSISLTGHTSSVINLLFAPNQKWLISGGNDETLRFWDLASESTGEQVIIHEAEFTSLSINPNCPWLAVGNKDGSIQLMDLDSPVPTEGFTEFNISTESITALDISSDCQKIAAGSVDTTVRLWDITKASGSNPILLEGHPTPIVAVAFDPQNRWLATASDDAVAILWDLTAEDPAEQPLALHGHEKKLTNLDITPDGHWLVTGSPDFTLRLWDLSSPDPSINSVVLPGINTLKALETDNDWIIIGSQDGIARLWPLSLTPLYDTACILAGRNLTQAEWKQYFSTQAYHQTCPQWPVGK